LEYTLKLSAPQYTDFGEPQRLSPLFDEPVSLDEWHEIREELKSRWEKIIGRPSFAGIDDINSETDLLEIFEHPEFNGKIYRQPTGPHTKQTVLLMEPKNDAAGPRPGAVVPFYHPDVMAGYDLTLRRPITEKPNIQFGLHLVRHGYIVLCGEAFPFNTVPEPVENKGFAWWQAAADKIRQDHPRWTGIGKLIWDTKRAVDLLLSHNVDPERIVVIGHSLGGKMAFCTAAFDDRIRAVIASDFGIGWDFTNWDADWYFGKQIYREGFNAANHQLLAMIAPRPFLLLGGQYDKPASWQYINEARKAYKLYGKETSAGFLDHASGHYPPEHAVDAAYRWLAEQFELPYREWKL
jgi:predicted esterase